MPRPDSRLVAVLLTALVAFGPISTDLYLPALPELTRALGADPAVGQLTLSVFLIGFAVSQLIYGPLGDRFGRRPILLVGLVVYVVASIACALAESIEALIVLRFFQALGACAAPVLARAVVRDVYGRERAAKVFAYMAMAMALAPALGPIVGGYMTLWFGWRSSFWLLTAFGVLVLAGTAAWLAETNPAKDPTATQPGQLARNYGTLVRHREFTGYVAVVAFTYSGIFAFISGSSFLFIDRLGLSPERYGMCFAAVVVGYMIGTFTSGRLIMRLGIHRMVRLGTTVAVVGGGAMLIAAVSGWITVASTVGPFFVFMIGAGLTLPNAMAGAIGPFPGMAALASSALGFAQMGAAAVIGVLVGQTVEAHPSAMAAGVFCVAAVAFLSHRMLIGPQPGALPDAAEASRDSAPGR